MSWFLITKVSLKFLKDKLVCVLLSVDYLSCFRLKFIDCFPSKKILVQKAVLSVNRKIQTIYTVKETNQFISCSFNTNYYFKCKVKIIFREISQQQISDGT